MFDALDLGTLGEKALPHAPAAVIVIINTAKAGIPVAPSRYGDQAKGNHSEDKKPKLSRHAPTSTVCTRMPSVINCDAISSQQVEVEASKLFPFVP